MYNCRVRDIDFSRLYFNAFIGAHVKPDIATNIAFKANGVFINLQPEHSRAQSPNREILAPTWESHRRDRFARWRA